MAVKLEGSIVELAELAELVDSIVELVVGNIVLAMVLEEENSIVVVVLVVGNIEFEAVELAGQLVDIGVEVEEHNTVVELVVVGHNIVVVLVVVEVHIAELVAEEHNTVEKQDTIPYLQLEQGKKFEAFVGTLVAEGMVVDQMLEHNLADNQEDKLFVEKTEISGHLENQQVLASETTDQIKVELENAVD